MRNTQPNILFVTSHFPHAKAYGAQLRVLNIARLLKKVGKVSFVIMVYGDTNIDQEILNRTKNEFNVKLIAHARPCTIQNIKERIRHELDPFFLQTQGFAVSDDDHETMLRMIEEHDVIWVHTLATANIFRIYRWPHTVLDIDDVQSRFFASEARNDSSIIGKLINFRRALIWHNRERMLKRRFDIITVCSNDDKRYFGNNGRIQVIPNGFTPPSEVPVHAPTIPPRIGFIGTLKYKPNQAGLEWFIRSVWPHIKREVPNVRLCLIGEGSDQYFPDLGKDICGLGWVLDPNLEISSWSAMIVPIQMGGGTRVKIAEAFSKKCPVVSTSLGAFGYNIQRGEDILIADNPEDFAAACVLLIQDKNLGLRLSENAWGKYIKNWTWDAIGTLVSKAVEQCLNN